jgi:alpha-L-fucosidase
MRSIAFTIVLFGLTAAAAAAATEALARSSTEPIVLWPEGAPGALGKEAIDIPTLTPYLPPKEKATGAAIVICPGGAYQNLAPHEGEPVAKWLNENGVAGFVLKYRIAPRYHHPAPLQDANRAIRTVRARAADWGIDRARIGILGFSAGGHLASSAGTHFDAGKPDAADPIERASSRPDLMVLVYPVVTMKQFTHAGSKRNLLGENPPDDLVALLSNEEQVTSRTPPAFLIHTMNDAAVPIENSAQFAAALRKAGVPYEFHTFESGPHGFGLGQNLPDVSAWPALCANWLRRHGFAAPAVRPPAALAPTPTKQQLAWQDGELLLFLHFGMNTFTDREWGDGKEDPKTFNPTDFDARQWARVAKEAGFTYVILTAKHHDGFCLWPSKFTEHSVKNSPWRGGKGDVVREVADAVRAEGLKFGFYLSPWDRHEPKYADNKQYDEHFRNQLAELLTNYGEIAEVWFDGAGGEGHVYDFPSYYAVIRRLQPHAVIAISGPDIRWVGNESGVARETEWSVQPRNKTYHGPGERPVWWPAECDVSIRPGWFWHEKEDGKVKSLEQLMDIYYKSAGRNAALLLNVPPNSKGRIADPDVQRLKEFRAAIDEAFKTNLAANRPARASSVRGADSGFAPAKATDDNADTYWATDDGVTTGWLEIDLGEPREFNVARLEEFIPLGQRIEKYRLEAGDGRTWRNISEGTTIGHKKLDRFPTTKARRVRLVIEQSRACPTIKTVAIYLAPPVAK